MVRGLLLPFTVVLLTTRLTWSQDPPPQSEDRLSPSTAKPPTREESKGAASHQTAEDLLRALQADKPAPVVVAPSSRLGKPAHGARRELLPEGTSIVDQTGRLVKQGSDWDFQTDEGWTVSILPNSQLESMAAIHRDTGGKAGFVVSGEVTVFCEQNYLLIKHATRGTGDATPPKAAPSQHPSGLPADASAKDVLSALESQRPEGKGVLENLSASSDRPSGRPALMEGSLVVRQSGRLLRREQQPYFVFDDSNSGIREVRILPNQALDVMEQSASRGQTGLVFLVSGELTTYGADNFLLVRGVTRMLDLGNFRP